MPRVYALCEDDTYVRFHLVPISFSTPSRSFSLEAAFSLGTNLKEGDAPLILPPVPLPVSTVCWVRRST